MIAPSSRCGATANRRLKPAYAGYIASLSVKCPYRQLFDYWLDWGEPHIRNASHKNTLESMDFLAWQFELDTRSEVPAGTLWPATL